MAKGSSYIRVSPYALIEYIYSDTSLSKTTTKSFRLSNNYLGEYSFLNASTAVNSTGNVLNNTAAQLGSNFSRWAYLSLNSAVPIINTDTNLILEDLTASITASTIVYDKMRIHLLSGYDFGNLEGFILDVQWKEWSQYSSSNVTMHPASYVYLKSELEKINFNTSPLFLGDRLYDRYIDVLIPSLGEANFDFWNSPATSAPGTLAYEYSHDGVGFVNDSQISVTLYEIDNIESLGSQQYFVTGTEYPASFNSSDNYSFVTANIAESNTFDYIEYYPTWNGAFIGDYIALLNETGNWVVINQIEVFEQVGVSSFKTFNMTELQDGFFDQPSVFRPVIKNSSIAFSYTVQYTMRLYNKSDNTEIIRRASFTSTDVQKYGPNLQKINVLEGFQPVKVYNKIVNITKSDTLIPPTSPQYITQTRYLNSYYNVNYISVDSTTNLSNVLGETVYPQGTNTVYFNRFDNIVKFKIFTKSADKKQNVSLDLASTGMNIRLAFITDDTTKIYVDPLIDPANANPGAGEILFKITSDLSIKLLGGSSREYYLVNRNPDGDDTLIYSGKFADQKDQGLTGTNNAVTLQQVQEKIDVLNTLQSGITGPTTAGGTASASSTLLNTNNTASTADTLVSTQDLSSAAASINVAINQAASADTNFTPQINIPEVPGVTPSLGADPLKSKTPASIENTTL